jgi:pyrroloquinoline quinone biosynthesis protein B
VGLAAAAGTVACGFGAGSGREAPATQGASPMSAAVRSGAYIRVVGTVQDGGLPHPACHCDRCEAARHVAGRKRYVASLALVLPAAGEVHLVDATPDIREQLDRLADLRTAPTGRVDRSPVDRVFLTHAHIGHYLGLAFFGYEALHTRRLPVHATPRMAAFLRDNGPWSQLVGLGEVELEELPPGAMVALADGVQVEALAVPHRDELSDTVGFVFSGPRQQVLYVPDTDGWDAWERPLEEVVAGVDVALLDGTFYSPDELPGRPVSSIGHPLITVTMDRLKEQVAGGTVSVYFTHLNHSNPALDPEGPERAEIRRRGFGVLEEGQELAL